MGVAKLFVWGEGVWRELDVSSGRVSGWRRRARFVFVRRGRLHVARRRAVLRALQALAAGRPGAAADGPRLSHRSKSAVLSGKHKRDASTSAPVPALAPAPAPAPPPAPCAHHHCCAHYNGCNNVSSVTRDAGPVPPVTRPASAAGRRVREAGTQCAQHAITINLNHAHHAHSTRRDSSGDEFARPARTGASAVSALLSTYRPGPESRRADAEPAPATNINMSNSVESGGGSGRGVCKELIVPESDVAALRGFVARTRASALARFDADDEYKRALFYAINPLVELERCERLERMLRAREAAARERFAARLGLAPRSEDSAPPSPRPRPRPRPRRVALRCLQRTTSSSSMDTDKENKEDKRPPTTSREQHERSAKSKVRSATSPRREAARVTRLGESARANREPGGGGGRAGRSAATAPPGDGPAAATPVVTDKHVISKSATAGGAKEYSNLEDHAIVAWVSGGARASLVNGNRVWRDLQDQYPRLTGRSRSWHSLRNRYLRYILPGLRALRLPPADESRLRAAAATGAIKKKNRASGATEAGAGAGTSAQRHPMFKEVAPRGASSRRPPRAPPHRAHSDHDDDDATYKPTASTAQDHGAARRSLRSEAHEQDGERASAPPRSPRPPPRSPPRPPRSPRYSDVTRRFAARHRPATGTSSSQSSPVTSPAGSPPAVVTSRSRRLYNPNVRM